MSVSQPLTAGSRLGPYEVLETIGAGGMGTVYRARDTRLGRDVAIKVASQQFNERFEREARAVASLNHPNICTLHDVGPDYLVMELVGGETLADRIAHGAVAIEEALRLARQIADALEAAHDRGIVHRDLKPGNIKVTADGTIKVLDFGLAKLDDGDAGATAGVRGADGLTQSPTIASPALLTGAGMIFGTAAYMSPEQARGKTVDKRTDLWAFGAVLYEMLTGARAFPGEDVGETLAAVIKGEPDWQRLPSSTPAPILRLLRRCLTKDPKRRVADASMARIEIDEALVGSPVDEQPTQHAGRRGERLALLSALGLVTVIAVGALVWALRPHPVEPEMRLEITTPPTTDPASLALSPNGKTLAFVSTFENESRLWIRSLDSGDMRSLAGTAGAVTPFWSPDSRSIGFFADEQLKRIDIDGGLVQSLVRPLTLSAGASWAPDGTILFGGSEVRPLSRMTASGGQPTALVSSGSKEPHRFPSFLPDGRHFLSYLGNDPAVRGTYLGALDDAIERRLFASDSPAVYYPPGYLLYVQQGTLFARAFDSHSLTVNGDAIAIASGIVLRGQAPALAVSPGRIAYRTGSGGGVHRQLAWYDRATGKEIATVGPPETDAQFPSLSRTGDRVLFGRRPGGPTRLDIWMLEIERNNLRPVVASPWVETVPLWSPDGSQFVFTSARDGIVSLNLKSINSTQSETSLFVSRGGMAASDWSLDGKFLLYHIQEAKTGWDLLALPMSGEKIPIRVATGTSDERAGQFSPNGKWVAFQSNESGREEVWVQSFPGASRKEQVSTEGGGQVRWSRDGKELFYLGLDDRLMAVPVSEANGNTIKLGTPTPLFRAPLSGEAGLAEFLRQQYEVSKDGKRFLINMRVEESVTTPITVILNWKPK